MHWRGCQGCGSRITAYEGGCEIASGLRGVAWARGVLCECSESTVLVVKVRGVFLPALECLGHDFDSIDFLGDRAVQPTLKEVCQRDFIQSQRGGNGISI